MGDRGDNYRLEKDYGAINSRTNPKTGDVTEVKLTKLAWFGREAKWDLRNWTGDYAGSGVVIGTDAALIRLRDKLIEVSKELDEEF